MSVTPDRHRRCRAGAMRLMGHRHQEKNKRQHRTARYAARIKRLPGRREARARAARGEFRPGRRRPRAERTARRQALG